jgi:hypothetical protein
MLRVFGRIAVLTAGLALSAPALAAVGCDAFKEGMLRGSGDLKAEFVRPLIVSRGGGSGLEAFDLVTRARIDGVLKCQGENFVSFEAKIAMPADADLISRFGSVQRAAMMSALGWSASRAEKRVQEIATEAADYLRASDERGDVAVAGKVEEHLPGSLDIGVIWTHGERTFIVLRNE